MKEKDTSMLFPLAIAFLILAILLWLWFQQVKIVDEDAENAAQRSIQDAETKAAELKKAAEAQLDRRVKRQVPIQSSAPETTIAPEKPTAEVATPESEIDTPPASEAELISPPTSIPTEPETPIAADSAPDVIPVKTMPEPEKTTEIAPSDSDDLQRIEGIGPKYEEILVAAGINTYTQIARMSEDQLLDVIRAGGGRKAASMATWAEQAALAAKGDWEALAELQAKLSGGRREE